MTGGPAIRLVDGSRPSAIAPAAGYTVAVASEERRPEVSRLIEESGARTVTVRAFRTIPQPDAEAIAEAVLAALATPPHEVIVSSAFGLRAWLAAARGLGRSDDLVGQLNQARLLARDARAADELRRLGLTTIWSTMAATTEELFRYLLAEPLAGRRIVAQIEADGHRELCRALRAAGAEVVEVVTMQTAHPVQVDGVRRLCDLVVRRQVDIIALTAPAATRGLIDRALSDGALDPLLNALVDPVTAVALGPLTAGPLLARGVPVGVAPVATTEELAATVVATLPSRAVVVQVGGHRLELRGQAVVIDERLVQVQSGPMAVLRALAVTPGRVLSAAQIRVTLPSSTVDDHAIEMAVSRLRSTLTDHGLDVVQTVMKRGYRLAV